MLCDPRDELDMSTGRGGSPLLWLRAKQYLLNASERNAFRLGWCTGPLVNCSQTFGSSSAFNGMAEDVPMTTPGGAC